MDCRICSVVRADEAYPLETFCKATGMGRAAVREARAAGLRVYRFGLRSWVLGDDWLNFLRDHAAVVDGDGTVRQPDGREATQ